MKTYIDLNVDTHDYINLIYKTFIAPKQLETVLNPLIKDISWSIYNTKLYKTLQYTDIQIYSNIIKIIITYSPENFDIIYLDKIVDDRYMDVILLKNMINSNVCNDLIVHEINSNIKNISTYLSYIK